MTSSASRPAVVLIFAAGITAPLSLRAPSSWGDVLRYVCVWQLALVAGYILDVALARLQAAARARLEVRRRERHPERFLLDVREISGGVQRRVLTSLGPEALRARRERRMNTVFLNIWPPCEPGMHVWEGRVAGDAWHGTWRRPTAAEIARHAAGEPVWRDG